jgi:ABC-2 type transport system ATP-binding protein
MTIFFTTHYLDEAEDVAGRIAIIDHGKIVASGSTAELTKQTGTDSLEDAYLKLTGSTTRDEADSGNNNGLNFKMSLRNTRLR